MEDLTATDEMTFVQTLKSLGANRNLAAAVTFLAVVDEATAKEIQDGAGISQPGVSKAMKALQELGWLEVRKTKETESGKPRMIYALNVSLEEVVRHYEAQKLSESALAMQSIEKLRADKPHKFLVYSQFLN